MNDSDAKSLDDTQVLPSDLEDLLHEEIVTSPILEPDNILSKYLKSNDSSDQSPRNDEKLLFDLEALVNSAKKLTQSNDSLAPIPTKTLFSQAATIPTSRETTLFSEEPLHSPKFDRNSPEKPGKKQFILVDSDSDIEIFEPIQVPTKPIQKTKSVQKKTEAFEKGEQNSSLFDRLVRPTKKGLVLSKINPQRPIHHNDAIKNDTITQKAEDKDSLGVVDLLKVQQSGNLGKFANYFMQLQPKENARKKAKKASPSKPKKKFYKTNFYRFKKK